jgi:hypothetical protein
MAVIYSKSIFTAPAVIALTIQATAFVLALLITSSVSMSTGFDASLLLIAFIQGSLASVISRWRRMAPWWLFIQFFFPLAVLAALSLHIPPVIFLAAFLFLLLIFWTTFRTQVPFYPSNSEIWAAVAKLLPQERPINFIDIGSGFGGLILHLDRQRSDSIFTGIELAPLPWLVSALRARAGHRRCRFLRGDYNELNFSHYDAVFAYLSPAAMAGLWKKAEAEMRPGSLLISYEFLVRERNPDITIAASNHGAELYCWRMKQIA